MLWGKEKCQAGFQGFWPENQCWSYQRISADIIVSAGVKEMGESCCGEVGLGRENPEFSFEYVKF